MTYANSVYFKDSVNFDAFGRLRTSEPHPLFDNMSEFGNNTYLWETSVTNGSVTHIANQNAVRLSTGGTTSGNKAIRQTRKYCRYQPGRSLNVETTFVMSASATNSYTRIGYYDASNGIMFERNGSVLNFIRRTNVTGTPTDTVVAQTDWNVDKLNGSGTSGYTLDVTKANIFFIQLQYLGVGRVQVGFVVDGTPIVCHQFLNANNLSNVYMSTGCLPVRGEVGNSGTSSGTITLDMICTSVSSGGMGSEKMRFARGNASNAPISTSTTLAPIFSIRAATLLGGTLGGGSIRNYGHIQPINFDLMTATNAHEWQILLNPTLTGANWVANNAASLVDYDISSTAVSGGTIIESGYIAANGANRLTTSSSFYNVNPLVYSGLNNVQDIITIAARTTNATGTALASITWDEEY